MKLNGQLVSKIAAGAAFTTLALSLAISVAAQASVPSYTPPSNLGTGNFTEGVKKLVLEIAKPAGTIIMGLAVLMIIWAAFKFMTAGDDKEAVGAARQTLIFALVGIVVALLAFALPTIISNVFTGQ